MQESGSAAGVRFHISSFSSSGGNSCVEVGQHEDGTFLIRHSKRPSEGATLTFTNAEWRAFLLGVKAGEFDPA